MTQLDHERSPATELVAELSANQELIDQGVFTLDSVKAREKLRAFQLADPNGYLLLLVEAACLAAPADREPEIYFTFARPLVVEFLSVELESNELEELLGGVFRRLEGLEGEARRRARALRLLGLAVNAALALAPVSVVVESLGTSGVGTSARFVANGELELVEVEREASARPRVRFELRFGPFENLIFVDERVLLRRHCRFAPFAIELDGAHIDEGLAAGLGYDGLAPHDLSLTRDVKLPGGEVLGLATKYSPDAPAVLLLLTRGVLSETLELDDMRPGFRAIVDVDLRKDLAQAKVLRDASFEAILDAVARAHDELPNIESETPDPQPPPTPQDTRGWSPFLVVGVVIAALALMAVWGTAGPTSTKILNSPRVSPDDARASLVCSKDDPRSCMKRAHYELERGGPDSAAQAQTLLATACEADKDACTQHERLDDAIVAGQRWRGSFRCEGGRRPMVLDIAADNNRLAQLTYRQGEVEAVVVLNLELEQGDNSFSTDLRRWSFPKKMRGQVAGSPNFKGVVSRRVITGTLPNENCSTFELTLESGVLPQALPE